MTEKPAPSEAQQELLNKLPAGVGELASEFGLTRSGVQSRITRIRQKGIDVYHDKDTDQYYPPQDDSEIPDGAVTDLPVDRGDVVDDLKEGGLTYADFANGYELSQEKARELIDVLNEAGYPLDFKVVDEYGTRLWHIVEDRDRVYQVGSGEGTYRFALISDTHLGSSAEHLVELHDFYDRLEDEGIEHVYHAGDITDGWEVHKGHLNVIKGEAAGWNRLLDYLCDNYPQRDGIDTFFIEGNHDRKYHRRNGVHFGELIDRRRDDLHYCGDSQATFVLDEASGIDLELIHPSGGKPYTQGYRAQTLYRERPPEDRPTLAGIGHLHGKMYASAEDVEAFYTGCWKGLTTYGKRKGHDSEIGGWILEIEIEQGELRRLSTDWIGYESREASNRFSAQDVQGMTDR